MRPRPLYRWKSFWFGLLTLAFMGWATVDSESHFSSVVYYTAEEEFAVARWQSETHFGKLPYRDRERGFATARFDGLELGFDLNSEVEGLGGTNLAIPDTAIFFSFLFGWIGWLVWRWQKFQKAKP